MRNIVYCVIGMLLMAGQAYAWGDENWGGAQSVTVHIENEPDYLQQRIETRQRRHDIQRAEQNRTLRVIRENDRRVRQEKKAHEAK
jgi:hypothetical protein